MDFVQQGEEDNTILGLLQEVRELYDHISSLPSLHPSPEVNAVLTELVLLCLVPSSVHVSALPPDAQSMRAHLIELCGRAEGLLEAHYSDILSSFATPLDHLAIFPYFQNYVKLTLLEHSLMTPHLPSPPSRIAFVGSGPLPLTSLTLALRHLPAARIVNYDLDPAANSRAARLLANNPDLSARVSFRTADIHEVQPEELRDFDVVFLAALVGINAQEKAVVLAHLARCMAPGALLLLRSAHGARAFLYPVVDPCRDLQGFELLSIYHPTDEVVNSVVVARKLYADGVSPPVPVPVPVPVPAPAVAPPPPAVMMPCKCCCELQSFNPLGTVLEELALEGQP